MGLQDSFQIGQYFPDIHIFRIHYPGLSVPVMRKSAAIRMMGRIVPARNHTGIIKNMIAVTTMARRNVFPAVQPPAVGQLYPDFLTDAVNPFIGCLSDNAYYQRRPA